MSAFLHSKKGSKLGIKFSTKYNFVDELAVKANMIAPQIYKFAHFHFKRTTIFLTYSMIKKVNLVSTRFRCIYYVQKKKRNLILNLTMSNSPLI